MSADILQWLNVLLLPMAWHAVRTGERIAGLEAQVAILLGKGAQP